MSNFYKFCHHMKICFSNTAKFTLDFPYYVYLFITTLVSSIWKRMTSKRKNLDEEIILITGAGGELGQLLSVKLALLSKKAILILWDINRDRVMETADKCRSLGSHHVHPFVVDLSSRKDIAHSADLVRRQIGNVTMLLNNAGIAPYKLFLDTEPDLEENVVRVNLLSQMSTIREFLPEMIAAGKGHVISICSAVGFRHFPYLSAFTASKCGLRGFMETLKTEMSFHPKQPNINFTMVYPTFINTAMSAPMTWEPRYQTESFGRLETEPVSDKIVDGILRNEDEIFLPGIYRYTLPCFGIWPTGFNEQVLKYTFRKISLVEEDEGVFIA